MAHEWKEEYRKRYPGAMFVERHRICQKCGAVQVYETEHEWMRVVGYRWLPLVGRCPKDKGTKPAHPRPGRRA